MSIGQFLLTTSIALWVFDSKKLPKLLSNLAVVIAMGRRYYDGLTNRFEQLLQQELNQVQLDRNEKQAQEVEQK